MHFSYSANSFHTFYVPGVLAATGQFRVKPYSTGVKIQNILLAMSIARFVSLLPAAIMNPHLRCGGFP